MRGVSMYKYINIGTKTNGIKNGLSSGTDETPCTNKISVDMVCEEELLKSEVANAEKRSREIPWDDHRSIRHRCAELKAFILHSHSGEKRQDL